MEHRFQADKPEWIGSAPRVHHSTSRWGDQRVGVKISRGAQQVGRGIARLFPIQKAVLEPAMQGREMIGRAMTEVETLSSPLLIEGRGAAK